MTKQKPKKAKRRAKKAKKRATSSARKTGVKRGPGGQFLPGTENIGGRKPGSLDGVVACKRFLSGQLAEMSVPGGDFERMIERRRLQGPDGIEWLWEHVFAEFVRKLPETAGQPITIYNVGIGVDRAFPPGMDRRPMLEQAGD